MIAHSGADRRVRQHHRPEWKVTYRDGRVTVNLPVTELSLSKSMMSNPRTTLSITSAPFGGRLVPFGAHIDVYWRDNPGQRWLPIALNLVVLATDWADGKAWRCEAADRSAVVIANQAAGQRLGSSNPEVVTDTLCRQALGSDFEKSNTVQWPSDAEVDKDEILFGPKWDWVTSTATENGVEAFFNYKGNLLVRPFPDVGDIDAGTLGDGVGGTVTSAETTLERGYNSVKLTYQLSQAPHPEYNSKFSYDKGDRVVIPGPTDVSLVEIWKALEDIGADAPNPPPQSAKWVKDGSYKPIVRGSWEQPGGENGTANIGNVDYLVQRTRDRLDRMPSQAQCDNKAARIAKRVKGRIRTDSLTGINHPWLEPGDTVLLDLHDRGRPFQTQIREVAFTMNNGMTIQCRQGGQIDA